MKSKIIKNCPICNSGRFKIRFKYNKRPNLETDFGIVRYNRSYHECKYCNHWVSNYVISKKFYENFYTKKTYQNNYLEKFNKIISLKRNSDNYFRSNRIENFLKEFNLQHTKILDVGSGLGIFPYEMKKRGFKIYALDPDRKMSNFIKNKLNIYCYNSDFINFKKNNKFNLITFNKVLEHVEKPVQFLKQSRKYLKRKNDIIYVEVPDTNSAKNVSKNREEFFIEHINCFSEKSLILLLQKCGFEIQEFKKIKEPSGKFTMYAFAKLKL
jgi:ubiquinone/menaquinone biosynthesis C-methylase UbiE